MLYLFDMDGTLIHSYMEKKDREYHQWEIMPYRREVIAALIEAGHEIAIVSNQGSVAFKFVTEADVYRKFSAIQHELGIGDAKSYICFHHPKGRKPYNDPVEARRRKPSGLMITEAMNGYQYPAAETVYIGDMDVDAEAAADAGVTFVHERDFFKNLYDELGLGA